MGAVDEYLSTVTDEADLASLARIYAIAQDLAPDAEQGTGYRMPALKLRGKALISATRTKTHIGVYPSARPPSPRWPERSPGFPGSRPARVRSASTPARNLPKPSSAI